jgi:hypothetical protein
MIISYIKSAVNFLKGLGQSRGKAVISEPLRYGGSPNLVFVLGLYSQHLS